MSASSEEFILRQVNIHEVMASGIKQEEERDKITDKFRARVLAPGKVEVTYRSPNQLSSLFKALAYKAAAVFNDKLDILCQQCRKEAATLGYVCHLKWPNRIKVHEF